MGKLYKLLDYISSDKFEEDRENEENFPPDEKEKEEKKEEAK